MRRYLIAGLLVWVPLGITIWVLVWLVTTLDQTLLLLTYLGRQRRQGAAAQFLLDVEQVGGMGHAQPFALNR